MKLNSVHRFARNKHRITVVINDTQSDKATNKTLIPRITVNKQNTYIPHNGDLLRSTKGVLRIYLTHEQSREIKFRPYLHRGTHPGTIYLALLMYICHKVSVLGTSGPIHKRVYDSAGFHYF